MSSFDEEERRRSQPNLARSTSKGRSLGGSKSSSLRGIGGIGLNSLEKQWSTSNISPLGEVEPGFHKKDRSQKSPHSNSTPGDTGRLSLEPSPFLSTRSIEMDGLQGMYEFPGPPAEANTLDSPKAAIIHSLDEESTAVTSIIHDAARITNWRTVNALSKSHPHCAKYTGQDRWTPLHHTCSRRCAFAEVYASLITAYPDALLAIDDKGWTPLHHACRFKAPCAAVRHLLHLFPVQGKQAATRRCNRGRTALYYAIRYDAPAGVVELMLEADPTAVLDEDRDGVCPLSIVWDKYASGIEGKRTLHTLLKVFECEAAGETMLESGEAVDGVTVKKAEQRIREVLEKKQKLRNKWEKANMLLRAAFRFPLQDDDDDDKKLVAKVEEGGNSESKPSMDLSHEKKKRKWRVLHAASAIKCHSTLFLVARALHPDQASELDEGDLYGFDNDSSSHQSPTSQVASTVRSNRTALHFAAASPACGKEGRSVLRSLLALNPSAAQVADDIDGSLPLHLISENERKVHWVHDGVRDVYQAFPDAVQVKDRLGRTPLHRAASNIGQGHTPLGASEVGSVIQNLINASPAVASIPDSTGRLPLHCIAEHGEGWDNDTESVLSAHKPAVRARTGPEAHSRLPIHLAAASPDAMPELLRRLVKEHPRGVAQADRVGKLPLHLACESGKSWDRGAGVIYNAFTPAISQPEGNKRGWNALHMAAASPNAGASLIDKLAELNPSAASTADKLGRYPLHWACLTGKAWDKGGMKAIFEAAPNVAMVEDSRGLLPLHAAALSLCEANKSASLDESVGDTDVIMIDSEGASPDNEQKQSLQGNDIFVAAADGDVAEAEKFSKEKAESPETLKQINIIYQLLNLEPSALIMK